MVCLEFNAFKCLISKSIASKLSCTMNKETDIAKAVGQHLEIDSFFANDFGVRGSGLEFEDAGAEGCAQEVQNLNEEVEPGMDMPKGKIDVAGELKKIAARIDKCRDCELGSSRNHTVPGEGNPNARLVFVGEAPGADEDASGKPFVGRAGKLLTKIIEAMGLSRDQIYICNTLKCRPPGNRDPKTSEKAACRHFLVEQLQLIKPEIVVALGSHAAKELLKVDKPIGQLRGKFHDFYLTEDSAQIKLMPTYHPSYLLRNYNYDSRKRVWEDMQKVLVELDLPIPKKNAEQ